jgi:AcrR family transcriptional regulator
LSIIEQDSHVAIPTIPALDLDRLRPAAAAVVRAVAARGAGFLSRRHILEATEACFVETGYDGTTIRAIAARLGCAVGSIYRYFTDKRELLLAVGAVAMQPVIDGLEAGDSLEASQRRYTQQAQRHGELYRLMFWLAWTPGSPAALPQPIQTIIDGWEDRLGSAAAARLGWAEIHGLLMLGEAAPRRAVVAPVDVAPVTQYAEASAESPALEFAGDPEDMTLL